MSASDLDKKFYDGQEEILGDFDLTQATRPNLDMKRINIDFPLWMIESFDKEARRIGVTRQSLIKLWLSEKVEMRKSETPQ